KKYTVPSGQLPLLVIASGVEARLIEAEADLRANGTTWLTILNDLRTDGTFTPPHGAEMDTVWHAGGGGVVGLQPLKDPALHPQSPSQSDIDMRIDLLFRERAYWLFLTGHRQGDLRRLIRPPYIRDPETLYPSGPYG